MARARSIVGFHANSNGRARMIYNHNDRAQAIVFIGNEGVIKELLFAEFEAILDGFVPLEEWSGRTAKAVYLELNSQFCPTAAVFFTLSFDSRGAVDRSWNLPLMDLARTAAKGPDLGAGPIHLVCASQAPVALFKDYLWDPDLKSGTGHLAQIKKALQRNKLALQFRAPTKGVDFNDIAGDVSGDVSKKLQQLSQKLGENYQKELRDHVAQLLQDQRLQMTALTAEKDKAVNDVRLDYLKKIEGLQAQLEQRGAQLHEVHQRNAELKDTIDAQAQKIEGLREYFEKKLERAQGQATDEAVLDAIRKQSTAQAQARSASALREADELMKMKDMELSFRKEHEESLQRELDILRHENQELLANGGDHVLEKLSRKGVNFVTYQPGAGHITIPLTQLPLFMDNPRAFTADYCGVSEKHYAAWLQHFQAPICQAHGAGGELCGENVERITNPIEFVDGESNYCAQHNQVHAVPVSRS